MFYWIILFNYSPSKMVAVNNFPKGKYKKNIIASNSDSEVTCQHPISV